MPRDPDPPERGLVWASVAILALLLVVGVVRLVSGPNDAAQRDAVSSAADQGRPGAAVPTALGGVPRGAVAATHDTEGRIFGDDRFLVAYYGTGGTGALGVLGETGPTTMHQRLERAARPFRALGEVQLVYELIVTIADRTPGPDGSYSHDVPRSVVEQYVEAARRNDALLLLDVQPGRSRFLDVAKRWEWALREPHVGLALDPEWRMGPGQVPGTVIGSTSAREVNAVTQWLATMSESRGLPEKLFVLHQFRTAMIRGIDQVVQRPGLAMVQHVDGFGTPREKRATYRAVARPRTFAMGFKLFYDEDVPRMSARDVGRVRPAVRFVSFQ